ncbi:MAG: hypothetical protein S4CHLAM20_06970 [Chlamydiia bacterium]|nr:hypothetical protein [Chlamydiia bacterium]
MWIFKGLLLFSSISLFGSKGVWKYPKRDLSKVKSVAIYRGNFDPLHKGHEAMIQKTLDEGVSHVFIFPAYGLGKKKQADYKIRVEALEAYTKKDGVSMFEFDIEGRSKSEVLLEMKTKVTRFVGALQSKGIKVYKIMGGDVSCSESKKVNLKVDGYIFADRNDRLAQNYIDFGKEVIFAYPGFEEISSSKIKKVDSGENFISFVSKDKKMVIDKY